MHRRFVLRTLACIALTAAGHDAARGQAPSTHVAPLALPGPSGPFAVGTTLLHLVDSTRPDPQTRNRFGGRPVTVQLWYPAKPSAAPRARAPYVLERNFVDSLIGSGYYDDTLVLRSWSSLRTHAVLDASPAGGGHPLVTESHGFGVARVNGTLVAEELASRGYVVAAIDHAHGGMMLLPDGSVSSTNDDSTAWNNASFHATQMNVWADDIGFVVDRMRLGTVAGVARAVARTADYGRVAAIGHSSGGLAAAEACSRVAVVRACVNMDGGLADPAGKPIVDFAVAGVTKPTLMLRSHPIYSDADFARRGRTREQWEASGRSARLAMDTLPRAASVTVLEASIAGTGHMSFTDAAFVMPTTITRFGGKIIDPKRGLAVVTTLLRAYLDEQLGLTSHGAFERTAAKLPEVEDREVGRARHEH